MSTFHKCESFCLCVLACCPSSCSVAFCAVCSSWDGKQGPVKDVYSLANNPQYKLEVQCPTGGAAVWVLLTRHITDKVRRYQTIIYSVRQCDSDAADQRFTCFLCFFVCLFRMILHKTGNLSPWLFTRQKGRRFITQVRFHRCRDNLNL